MREFLLTEEPWIPCETLTGSRVELGLRETLERAHELRAIDDSSPLVTAALHRLLLSILHRCFGPADMTSWTRLYQAGRFETGTVRAYLETWRDRFFLLHPERPFYQCADENMSSFEADSPARLAFERSNYGAPVSLFQHRPEGHMDAISYATAARLLVGFQAYVPGGLVRKPGEPPSGKAGPLNRGALVLLCGSSLFETLTLNLLIYRAGDSAPIPNHPKADCPAWERVEALRPEDGPPFGWLDLLTWQSRRLLFRSHAGTATVSGVVVAVGRGIDGDIRDPMLAWKKTEKAGFLPLSFSPSRAFWRDCHALFLSSAADGTAERPAALSLLATPQIRRVVPIDRRFNTMLLGLAGDQAKILLSRAERLPISPALVADPNLGSAVHEVLQTAEQSGGALRNAVRLAARRALSPGEREPDTEDVSRLVKGLGVETEYWGALRPFFDRFLESLLTDESTARKEFTQAVQRGAENAFHRAEQALGEQAHHLRGAAEGGRLLQKLLAQIRPKEQTT